MKVKTARGWVPVKRLNRKRTRIGHIPISHKATALVSKKLLDPWYTHPKTKEMSKDLPWMRDVNIFDDPDDPRPNQFRMYNRNNWRPMHEWLRRNPPAEFPSEQQFSKKIKDVTGKTFDVEFTLRVTWDGNIPGDIKGTAQRLQDNKAVVKIVLNKKYVETTHRRDVEREVQRVTAHEIAHVMDPHAGKNYVAPERHYGAYINSPGEVRARLVEVTRDLLETGRVVAIEDQLQQKEDVTKESFRSRPQLVINPEKYLFQSPTYSRVQRYFTDETNKKFLKLAASIITAIAEGKVKTGIWHSVTKATKVPKKYLSGLSSSAKKERKAEIRRRAKDKDTAGYKDLPGDKDAKTKPSKYSRTQLAAKVRKETKGNSDDEFLRAVAKFTGISTRILRQVHKRGAAAWASGHRPGASQAAWSRARVYSFATGGKTRRTADKDLWAKHSSTKKAFALLEVFLKSKESCPAAAGNLKLNTKNRNAAIKQKHIKYGPLNVDEPGDYWKDIAEFWDTTEKAAKEANCSNCVAFDISPRMDKCMPGETSDEDGRLGYCWMHHFKCHSARACRTWAKGGPVKSNSKSLNWQERGEDK